MTALHTIAVEIHVARKELPRDVAAVIPYGELVAAALLTLPTLSGTVDTIRAGKGLPTPSAGWPGVVKRRLAGACWCRSRFRAHCNTPTEGDRR